MLLRKITMHNVRSYDLASFEFDANVTLILGPNGSGKTTILEGVYYLMRGTSFRGRDKDVIPYEHEASELKLELEDLPERRGRLDEAGARRTHVHCTGASSAVARAW